jgi:hypothetical protein
MNTISRITVELLHDKIHEAAQAAAPLFNLYGWTYGDSNVPPTHSELVDTITRLTESALEYFYKSEEQFRDSEVGSGRFSVRVKEFEDEVDVRIVLDLASNAWFKAHPRYV